MDCARLRFVPPRTTSSHEVDASSSRGNAYPDPPSTRQRASINPPCRISAPNRVMPVGLR
ncbi:hypothetical protein FKP32DRAFT_504600 [Trametes sanguinea]|nr:hypothetical protein FKP32DRAFT_504600 [Trametes sanguinea]